MPAEFDISGQLQGALASALKSFPWYFWVIVVIGIVVKALPQPRRKRRVRHAQPISQRQHVENNERIMPCPDCKGKVSINASNCPHCGAPIPATYVDSVVAKREKAKRVSINESLSCLIVFADLVTMAILAVILMLVVHFTRGWLMWTLVVFLGLLLVAEVVEFVKLRDKGKFGEQLVHTILSQKLPKEKYRIVNDVFLPLGESGTTQIDHIVVSVYGVFVVETKNYAGWVFADANSANWTQVLGGRKSQFQNPIRQNYLHICALSDNLGLPMEIIYGIVAFSDKSEFKTVMPEGVVFFTQIASEIKKHDKPIIRQDEADDILSAIREWNDSITPEQRRNHVENIQNRIAQKQPQT